jgi:phosphatidylserine/phosphatidylglycerophosphate/cardiolipin synthase-like enzyme
LVDAGMLDGSLRPILQELADAGAEISWWNSERGILHLKTAVIDQRYVWTGSANWTPNALDRNVEDMLLMDSTSVAATYLGFLDSIRPQAEAFQPAGQLSAEMKSDSCVMRDGFMVGLPPTGARTNWNNALDNKPFPSFDSRAFLQYLPDDQYYPALIKLIREARQSVQLAMFVFTPPKINEPLKDRLVKTLVEAAQRGVYVQLVLDLSAGEGDALAQAHEDWAEALRKQGIDVRLSVPAVSLHAKLVVVDQARVLIGSHNWTEGALSGERIYESTTLLTLPYQDRRWAEYFSNLETVADMRSRAHWQEELRQIRQLGGLRGKAQSAYLQELEGSP